MPTKHLTPVVRFESGVLQRIRQHGRSSMEAEICGVLLGSVAADSVVVDACIPGEHAIQSGAQVTFTQDTWEHIFQLKDRDFPDKKIVGWYHSHPGFGVFLSEHDVFIHENFFSAAHQIAWVYDPHSDEEGCFAWHAKDLRRVEHFEVIDRRAIEPERPRPEPGLTALGKQPSRTRCSWWHALCSLWNRSPDQAPPAKPAVVDKPGPVGTPSTGNRADDSADNGADKNVGGTG